MIQSMNSIAGSERNSKHPQRISAAVAHLDGKKKKNLLLLLFFLLLLFAFSPSSSFLFKKWGNKKRGKKWRNKRNPPPSLLSVVPLHPYSSTSLLTLWNLLTGCFQLIPRIPRWLLNNGHHLNQKNK